MPFVPEDPNNPTQTGQQPQNQPVTTSSAPGAGPVQGKGSSPQSTPAQPFQNLQAYLSANQPQIQQQANTISGNLQNQYGQVQSDINKGVSDFGSQVQGGYAQPNAEIVNQASSNPTEFVKNPDNVKAFQGLYNDVYSGPSNFESSGAYGDLSSSVNKAMSDAALFNTNAGMQTYLQGQNPNMTKGGSILDSVLLQGSPEAIKQVQGAAKPLTTLNDYLTQATTGANQKVSDAQAKAQAISKQLQDQFNTGSTGVIPAFENQVNSEWQGAQKQAADRAAAVKAALALSNPNYAGMVTNPTTGKLESQVSDQTLADLGITRDQLEVILAQRDAINATGKQSPIDLAQYLGLTQQDPSVAVNRANFSTPEEYAKAAALAQLTGNQEVNGAFLNPADISQAGTANLDLSEIKPESIKALNDLSSSLTPVIPPSPPPNTGTKTGDNGKVTIEPWDRGLNNYVPNPAGTDTSKFDPNNPPPGWTYYNGQWSQNMNYKNPKG